MAGASGGGASASAVKAGEAFVSVSAKTTGIEKAFNKIGKDFDQLGKRMTKTGLSFAALGAVISGPLELAKTYFIESGSAATDMAERLNTTTETITALGYAASLAGGGIEDVESNLGKMQKTIAEGAAGGDTFFGGLLGKSVDEQLAAMADLIGGISDKTLQSAAALEIFGKSGRKMLPFLKEGASGLAKLRESASKYGAIISKEEAERADRVGDAFTNIFAVVKSVGRAVGGALLPDPARFEGYADMAAGAGATIRDFIGANAELLQIVEKVGIGLTVGGSILAGVGEGFGAFGDVIKTIGSVLGFVFSPTGLILTGAAVLAGTITTLSAQSGQLSANMSVLGQTFGTAFGAISDALKSGDLAQAAKVIWETLKSVGEQILLFFEKLWNEIEARTKIFMNNLTSTIAEKIRQLLLQQSDWTLGVLGMDRKDLQKAGAAIGAETDLKNQDIDKAKRDKNAKLDKELEAAQRELARNTLPIYKKSMEAAAGASEDAMEVAVANVAASISRAAGSAATVSGIRGGFGTDSRGFAYGDNVQKEQLSTLQKILEADQQGNKLLEKLNVGAGD